MNSKSEGAWLRYGMYLLMSILGVSVTMVAPMLDGILHEYQLSLSLGGMFTGAMSIGGLLTILLLGVFSDRMSKTRIVVFGGFVFAAALILICFAPNYAFLLLFFALVGIGSKVVDTLSNAVIKDAHGEGSGTYLSLMHMFLGIGAITGPLISGNLLGLGVRWQYVFAGLGLLCALITLMFWFIIRRQKTDIRPTHSKAGDSAFAPFKAFTGDRRVWILCLVVFFYVGHQSCMNTWASLYFQKQFGSNDSVAGIALAAYWLGIVISRLLCSRFYTEHNAKPVLLWGSALGAFALGLGILINAPLPLLCALFCCGVLTGGTIPIVIDLTCGLHPALSGAITSLVYIFMTAGPFIFPVLMGSISDAFGMQAGISIAVISLLLMCGSCLLISSAVKDRPA